MKVARPLRFLVVEDSPQLRAALAGFLTREYPDAVVETASNGQIGLRKALASPVDFITLDLSMPVMDGYTFLRLFRQKADVPVVVVSSLDDLEHVEKALELGASGFLAKPRDAHGGLGVLREELCLKLQALLRNRTPRRARKRPEDSPPTLLDGSACVSTRSVYCAESSSGFPVAVVGCSSGGPPTLEYLLSGLPRDMTGAVVVAQHMPPGFTTPMVERLDRLLPLTIREAAPGDELRAGVAYFCPGGANTRLVAEGGRTVFAVEEASRDELVPSVDVLFSSAAAALGSRAVGIVLTGMGNDGTEGVRRIKQQGGRVIAESEETALVYGMPRQAAATGCVDEQLPLPAISVALLQLLQPRD